MLQARSTVNGSETQQDRDDFLFYSLRLTSKTQVPIRLYIAFWS